MAYNLFKEHTKEGNTNSTCSYLLGGLFNISKYETDSNYRKLLDAFSRSFLQLEQQINAGARELDPDETYALISQWERQVGIPDNIFDNNGTVEERRNNVLIKLASLGVQTKQDFIGIAGIIGYDRIRIITGGDAGTFPLTFPFVFFSTPKEARFTVLVDLPKELGTEVFPLPFPFKFRETTNVALEKLFDLLKPANVRFIYRYIL